MKTKNLLKLSVDSTTTPDQIWDYLSENSLLWSALDIKNNQKNQPKVSLKKAQALAMCLSYKFKSLSPAMSFMVHDLCLKILANLQFDKSLLNLKKFALGQHSIAFCISETKGSNPKYIKTTATKTNGGYKIKGIKTFVSNCNRADHYFVIAKTGELENKNLFGCFLLKNGKDIKLHEHATQPFAPFSYNGTIEIVDCFVDKQLSFCTKKGNAFDKIAKNFRLNEEVLYSGAVLGAIKAQFELVSKVINPKNFSTEAVKINLAILLSKINLVEILVGNIANAVENSQTSKIHWMLYQFYDQIEAIEADLMGLVAEPMVVQNENEALIANINQINIIHSEVALLSKLSATSKQVHLKNIML